MPPRAAFSAIARWGPWRSDAPTSAIERGSSSGRRPPRSSSGATASGEVGAAATAASLAPADPRRGGRRIVTRHRPRDQPSRGRVSNAPHLTDQGRDLLGEAGHLLLRPLAVLEPVELTVE